MQDTSWVVKMEKDIGQFMIANYLPSSKERTNKEDYFYKKNYLFYY